MNQKAQQQAVDNVIDALRVVVAQQTLLIPMAAVAEVVRGASVLTRESDEDWLHGWLQWRELEIPLVALESMLNGEKGSHAGTANALIVNTLGKSKGLDFYALLLNDLPHPERISSTTELLHIEDQSSSKYQLTVVQMGEEHVILPDLQGVEKFLRAKL